jgi:hypothetical protein
MFIRFREITAQRYGGGERECVGKCKDRPRHYPRWGAGFIVRGRTFLEGCPMKPLCPLVYKRHRLEVSIVETRRDGGKVKHKHVASLGSVWNDSPAEREGFWRECEARLARLANRLAPDLDRLRQAIAARIPPLTDVIEQPWPRRHGMRLKAGLTITPSRARASHPNGMRLPSTTGVRRRRPKRMHCKLAGCAATRRHTGRWTCCSC